MSPEHQTTIDLVIPVFNESGVVEQTHASLCQVIDPLPHKFTIYYVDDGSQDDTVRCLTGLAEKDERI
ncbi:MAG TPA: glycosyltransferase, partial [Anaerolineales bacterium]|nr:glycosyltransferase [Anaerolineales bacterium]